jgi:hypothetical protein
MRLDLIIGHYMCHIRGTSVVALFLKADIQNDKSLLRLPTGDYGRSEYVVVA